MRSNYVCSVSFDTILSASRAVAPSVRSE